MTTETAAETTISFSKLKIWRKIHKVSDLAQASKIFRDSVGERGASTMPDGLLFNDKGEQVAHISYNGKVWAGAEYEPNAVPLYVPTYES